MDYRQLGRSGLRVSTLTLGTMSFGDAGPGAPVGSVDLDGARRQIDQAVDAGINLIDTADVYAHGRSEEIIGEALQGRRDRVLLATKARMAMGEGPNDTGLSRAYLTAACEASLRRLRTDYIDLFQVHEWDGQTPLEETLDTLDGLVRAGKVRYVGCSNYAGWQLMKALGISERRGLQRFVRRRVRARAGRPGPGRGHPHLEPAGRRPAVREVPSRPSRSSGRTPCERLGRAANP